ncbi:MAG: uroporphyrinogen-III synthase [Planctomycetes bacterium]|nr:uroporphyrinogen-III synthase [Planctomycetota bacterium]
MAQRTLSGLHIALTRESEANAELAAELVQQGATVHDCPLIRIQPPDHPAPLLEALEHIDQYDWLILTSVNAARAVLSRAKPAPALRIACVGSATSAFVTSHGLQVTLQPTRAHSKGMLEALAEVGVQGASALWPRGNAAPATLKEGLQALGAVVDDPVAYRNVPDLAGLEVLSSLLRTGTLHAIAFASSSAAENAAAALSDGLKQLRLYSIGPSTSRTLEAAGLQVAGEAADHSARGLAQVIVAGESQRG